MPKAELFIRFPNQSESFAHGCEYGRILEQMERGDMTASNRGMPVRIENIDLLRDTATKYGYICFFGIRYFEEWVDFIAINHHASDI